MGPWGTSLTGDGNFHMGVSKNKEPQNRPQKNIIVIVRTATKGS